MKNLALLFLLVFIWVLLLPLYPAAPREEKPLPRDEYVLSVMLGMGTDILPEEALKAIAVTVRSYTAYHGEILPAGSVSDVADKTSREHAEKVYSAMEKAVYDTSGQYLTYGGSVINACFHVSSHLFTADGDAPYLKSVPTPDESECMGYYTQTDILSRHGIILSVSYGSDGRAVSVQTENGTLPAQEFVKEYNIPSNNFTVNSLANGGYKVTSYGTGNGVGLSLYGTYKKALAGEKYTQILSHYFPGTALTQNTQ